MRKMKKWTALLLAAAMTAGLLAGCGGSGQDSGDAGSGAQASKEESAKEEDSQKASQEAPVQEEGETAQANNDFSEHLDISLAFWDVESNLTGTPDDKVLKTLEEKFNVTFVPQNISWDDYEQKLQLWAASDSLPDIFMGAERTKASFAKWANEGLLREIPADLSAYENLSKYMDSPELPTCQVNGKTYCIFRQTYKEQAYTTIDRMVAYRWDLAQEAGTTKEPENWDEFREMIQAIIAADPEGKGIQGMTSKGYKQLTGELLTYSMPLAAVSGVTFYWVDKGDGTYVPAYFAGENLGDAALPTWHLIRDMYTEGTIEKDIAVTTSTQALEKFLQGSNAAILIDGGAGNIYNDVAKYWNEIYGNDFLDDVKFLSVMQDQNGNLAYPIWDYAWSESYISSHVDDAKMERILALYDYMLSREGVLLTTCGIEGESYGIEDGKIVYEGYGTGAPGDTFKSINVFANLVSWTPGMEDSNEFPNTVPQEFIDINDAKADVARSTQIPAYNYDCTVAFVGLGSDFALNVDDDMLSIMTGTEDVEKMWNDIIDKYKADGLEDIIAQVNEAMK